MAKRWSVRMVIGIMLASLTTLATAMPAGAATYPQPRSDEWWFSAWGVQDKLWPISQGAGITVAVLDSGVQANLPEFSGAVLRGTDATGGSGDGRSDVDDAAVSGHGTAMASLIVGQGGSTHFVGVAPKAKILPIIADDESSVARGIRYATDNGAQVINISQGGARQCTTAMQQAVDYAIQHEVVIVAGSGDSGDGSNASLSPANCPGVLAVGAISVSGGKFVSWSKTQQQSYVAVAAPGGNVGGVLKDGQFHTSDGGTSQAAALTSAAVALVRSKYPKMSARDVVQRVTASCLDVAPSGKDDATGYGIIRVYHALTSAPPKSAPNPVFASYDKWKAANGGQDQNHGKSTTSTPSARRSTGELVTMGIIFIGGIAVIVGLIVFFRRKGGNRNSGQPAAPYGGPPQGPPSFGPPQGGDSRSHFQPPPNQGSPPERR